MPTFDDVEIDITQKIDIEFEVFCNTCGKGLCGESDTRKSRGRNYLQVTVNACPDCMASKDEEIQALKYEIEQLNEEINKLNT